MHSRGSRRPSSDDTSQCRVFAPYSCPSPVFVGTGFIETASLQSFVDSLESWIKRDQKLRFSTKAIVLKVLKDALCDASPTPTCSTRHSIDLADLQQCTCGHNSEQNMARAQRAKVSDDIPEITFSQSIRRYFGRSNGAHHSNTVNAATTIQDDQPRILTSPSPSGVRLRLCDGFQVFYLLTYMYMSNPHRLKFSQVTTVYSRIIPFNFSFDELLLLGGIDPSDHFFLTSPRVDTWRDSLVILGVLANDGSGSAKAFARLREGVVCYLRIFPSLLDGPLEKLPCRNSPDIALTEAFRKLTANLRMMRNPNSWYS
ncbi:hypothetical protein PIIN_00190 [Serendipita indica DSM 11827]|uniref:Uncharacterized protein n=1 Tax=Serendipita indica (strain DSM 11827) TaxID=1109443 RepID=G4T5C4_SERID|nr:hypothetical protein PIIN_00190 [Serendipita indica DSM 11827]